MDAFRPSFLCCLFHISDDLSALNVLLALLLKVSALCPIAWKR